MKYWPSSVQCVEVMSVRYELGTNVDSHFNIEHALRSVQLYKRVLIYAYLQMKLFKPQPAYVSVYLHQVGCIPK